MKWQWQGINRVKPELAGSIAGDAKSAPAVSSNTMLSSSSEVGGEKSHLGVPLKDAIERDFGSLDNLQNKSPFDDLCEARSVGGHLFQAPGRTGTRRNTSTQASRLYECNIANTEHAIGLATKSCIKASCKFQTDLIAKYSPSPLHRGHWNSHRRLPFRLYISYCSILAVFLTIDWTACGPAIWRGFWISH